MMAWARYALGGVVALVTALLAILGYGYAKKQEGLSEARTEALEGDAKKRGEAREAAFKEKRETDGLSAGDLLDRLRRRTDDWGGL